MTLKCGCIYDDYTKSFVKYCRAHALMVLRKRWEKYEKQNRGGKG